MKDLTVIIPVFNEEGSIKQVITDWISILRKLGIDFTIRVYNDGSTDKTMEVLKSLKPDIGGELDLVDKPNSGHGPTILEGYRQAQSEWIFQTDADNEIYPEHFFGFWESRQDRDLVIGYRTKMKRSLHRRTLSSASRLFVSILFGRAIRDVNCPYRLMRTAAFRPLFGLIPGDTFAPNAILSGCAINSSFRILEIPVQFHQRTQGETSLKRWSLVSKALKSFRQTAGFWLFVWKRR